MAARTRRQLLRTLAIAILELGVLGLGLVRFDGARPARAQEADRIAVVLRFIDAENRGDLDTAVAQFADTAVFIGSRATGNCSQKAPCTDLAGIREQAQGSVATHVCFTIRSVQASGSVVTLQYQVTADTLRAIGIERLLATIIAVVPKDKITFYAALNDLSDPQTALNAAINAGTQPAGTPIPKPTTPCADVS